MIILSGAGTVTSGDFDEADLLWRVRADDLALSDGDPVVTWADSSGNGHDWVQATSARRPTLQTNEINGHAAVQFATASQQYLNGPDLSGLGLTEVDVFIVLKSASDPHDNVSKVGLWLLGNISAQFFSLAEFNATDGLIKECAFHPGVLDERLQFDPTPSLTSWRLYRVIAKTGQTLGVNNYQIHLDGVSGQDRNMAGLSFGAITHLGRSVWNSGSNTSHWDGMVAEFFAFDAKCGSTQLDSIHDYLNGYYGFSL